VNSSALNRLIESDYDENNSDHASIKLHGILSYALCFFSVGLGGSKWGFGSTSFRLFQRPYHARWSVKFCLRLSQLRQSRSRHCMPEGTVPVRRYRRPPRSCEQDLNLGTRGQPELRRRVRTLSDAVRKSAPRRPQLISPSPFPDSFWFSDDHRRICGRVQTRAARI
jgi:hypothetical protein